MVATRARRLRGCERPPALPWTVPAHVLGHFSGPFHSQASNVPIAPGALPDEFRTGRLVEVRFFDGVAELESLASAMAELRIPWPSDALLLVQILVREGKLDLNGNVLNEAHQVVSRSMIIGILRTVRDRVLSLALRLEQENPHLGDSGSASATPAVGRDVRIIVNGASRILRWPAKSSRRRFRSGLEIANRS